MKKVLILRSYEEEPTEGMSDLVSDVNGNVKIVGVGGFCVGNEFPIQRAFVVLDTIQNRKLLEEYRVAYKTWKKLQPNVYELRNHLQQ